MAKSNTVSPQPEQQAEPGSEGDKPAPRPREGKASKGKKLLALSRLSGQGRRRSCTRLSQQKPRRSLALLESEGKKYRGAGEPELAAGTSNSVRRPGQTISCVRWSVPRASSCLCFPSVGQRLRTGCSNRGRSSKRKRQSSDKQAAVEQSGFGKASKVCARDVIARRLGQPNHICQNRTSVERRGRAPQPGG